MEDVMGQKRPYKVRFHFDGTKQFSNDALPEAYVIDTSRPIDGCSSHTDISVAEAAARRVSRNGGSARILLRDSSTGVESEITNYEPYEAAMQDLAHNE